MRAAPPGTGGAALAVSFPRADSSSRRTRPGRTGEMAVPLDDADDIRAMDAAGVPRAEIARRLRLSRDTVAKYADMAGMSPAAPRARAGAGGTSRGEAAESRLSSLFRAHYRCASRYCNPCSGNGKGSVENAVGFVRRNLLVPVPSVGSLGELNGLPGPVASG